MRTYIDSHRESHSKNKSVEVGLEFFKQHSTRKIIGQADETDQLDNKLQFVRAFKDNNNNVLLACAYSYLINNIIEGRLQSIIGEIYQDVQDQCGQLINVPQAYKNYFEHETIQMTLLNGITRLRKGQSDEQRNKKMLEDRLAQLVNMYPFFRFCLMIWMRCKAMRFLNSIGLQSYISAMGNEPSIISNIGRELRNVPLEILVDSLGILLQIKTLKHTQRYGTQPKKNCKKRTETIYVISRDIYLVMQPQEISKGPPLRKMFTNMLKPQDAENDRCTTDRTRSSPSKTPVKEIRGNNCILCTKNEQQRCTCKPHQPSGLWTPKPNQKSKNAEGYSQTKNLLFSKLSIESTARNPRLRMP